MEGSSALVETIKVSNSMRPRSVLESGGKVKPTKKTTSDLKSPSNWSRITEESTSTITSVRIPPKDGEDTSVSSSVIELESSCRIRSLKRSVSPDLQPPAKRSRVGKNSILDKNFIPLDVEDDDEECSSSPVDTIEAEFEDKYMQEYQLGAGGFGSVYSGYRRVDYLPVAIKHIPKCKAVLTHTDENGKQLPIEVAIMLQLQKGVTSSLEKSSIVSLLDWYALEQELILVMERPEPVMDLFHYILNHDGGLQEEQVKVIIKQLINAAKHLEENQIFHRDIKVENILIETGSSFPVARLIDFGLSCFTTQTSVYKNFAGAFIHASPEWLNYSSYKAGPATVWQIGVVMFEALHGSRFTTSNFLRGQIKISKKLSPDCQGFLKSCLSWCPEIRPTLEELQSHPWLS